MRVGVAACPCSTSMASNKCIIKYFKIKSKLCTGVHFCLQNISRARRQGRSDASPCAHLFHNGRHRIGDPQRTAVSLLIHIFTEGGASEADVGGAAKVHAPARLARAVELRDAVDH